MTTLKMIFAIFGFFARSDSRFSNICASAKYCPVITVYINAFHYINGKLICSAFRLCINLSVEKRTLMNGLVVQGHKYLTTKTFKLTKYQILYQSDLEPHLQMTPIICTKINKTILNVVCVHKHAAKDMCQINKSYLDDSLVLSILFKGIFFPN